MQEKKENESGHVSSEIEICRAGLEDLELLMQWRMEVLHDVFSIPENQPVEALAKENRRYYEQMLPSEGHIACFAKWNGKLAGCGGICIYQEMPSPDNPGGGCGYLMNIYTRPTFRGRGIGRRVVDWLVEQARMRNITRIYLETSDTGRSLYERSGFVEMQNMMQKRSQTE